VQPASWWVFPVSGAPRGRPMFIAFSRALGKRPFGGRYSMVRLEDLRIPADRDCQARAIPVAEVSALLASEKSDKPTISDLAPGEAYIAKRLENEPKRSSQTFGMISCINCSAALSQAIRSRSRDCHLVCGASSEGTPQSREFRADLSPMLAAMGPIGCQRQSPEKEVHSGTLALSIFRPVQQGRDVLRVSTTWALRMELITCRIRQHAHPVSAESA